ncbi:MAG: diacylglycerol kinase family lipid kinase [Planctomycetaceae bacterium]|nr:diacylglycerol kinase family lipid kinase [Planctomycetaceae bacterium]
MLTERHSEPQVTATAKTVLPRAGRRLRMHVIWNTHAGSASRATDVRHRLMDFKVSSQRREQVELTLTIPQSAADVPRIARKAAQTGTDVVVAAGGDGTINAVVQGLAEANFSAALGVIPLGTGNDFCRNLQMPLDPFQALDFLDHPVFRRIDVMQTVSAAGEHHFVNMATAGNTGHFSSIVTEDMKHFWGPLVYLRGVVDVLSSLQKFQIRVTLDDEPEFRCSALNLYVANGPGTGGGMVVASDASMEDGLMDVVILRECSPLDIASLAARYTLGDYRESEFVYHRRARRMTLHSEPALEFSLDGEPVSDQPSEIKVLPGALWVLTSVDRDA